MNTICVIGARGGSKGVLDKNIKPLLGKPLIAWSIEQALRCSSIKRVVVSTDCENIAAIARKYGAETPFMRPAHLANDSAGKWQVWQHALEACDQHYPKPIDLFVDLDCTSPLRLVSDIDNALAQFQNSDVDAVFSICEARKNPYFNMVEYRDNRLVLSKQLPNAIVRRQDAPTVYEHAASVYVLSPDYLRRCNGLLDGNTRGYLMPATRCVDVDSQLDYDFVEYLMQKNIEPEKDLS